MIVEIPFAPPRSDLDLVSVVVEDDDVVVGSVVIVVVVADAVQIIGRTLHLRQCTPSKNYKALFLCIGLFCKDSFRSALQGCN